MAVFVTVKVVEPRLGQYTGTGAGEEVSAVTGTEKKALKWAVIAVAVYLAVILAGVVPGNGILRDPETGSPIASAAPLMKGLPFLIALLFFIPGVVYGKVSGAFKGQQGCSQSAGAGDGRYGTLYSLDFCLRPVPEIF